MAIHVWDKGLNIQNETKLLKYITNPKDLTVWEKLFIKKSEDLVMNLNILSENYLIESTVDSHKRSYDQSETAEYGKNDFLKTFLNLREV